MSIMTKSGDRGKTALISGERVFKDDPRIDLVGELDELCSFLGAAKSLLKSSAEKQLLESVQSDLFTMGAEIAAGPLHVKKLKKRISNSCVKCLDEAAVKLENSLKPKKRCFCLPGENVVSGTLDVARSIARRCERRITKLSRKKMLHSTCILKYINRLSDLLYLLARKNEARPRHLKP